MNGNHAVGGETTAHEFSPITTNEDYSIHNSCAFVLIRGKDKVRSIEKEKENEREKKQPILTDGLFDYYIIVYNRLSVFDSGLSCSEASNRNAER